MDWPASASGEEVIRGPSRRPRAAARLEVPCAEEAREETARAVVHPGGPSWPKRPTRHERIIFSHELDPRRSGLSRVRRATAARSLLRPRRTEVRPRVAMEQ